VERIVSFYHYILRSPTHYLHDRLRNESIDLRGFVEKQLTLECDNLQVRYLCSDDLSGVAIGACTRSMLEQAKENLASRFAAVGLMERFDQSLQLTAQRLGWKKTESPRINIAAAGTKRKETDATTLALIKSANELDAELYQFAAEQFAKN
ncbi:MAG: hypothetical protein ACRD3W_05290, partial [Terriglobales bacterium]